MKISIFVRILCVLLTFLSLLGAVGCNTNGQKEPATDSATDSAETVTDEPAEEDNSLHVIIASDVHHTTLQNWYGVTSKARMQWWVNDIKAEHEKNPIDLLIIAGDTSLDHLENRGTYTTGKLSTTKSFMDDYVSQLPDDIPVFVLPGNHEQFSREQWKKMTGNDRFGTIAIKGNLFIMLDNYNSKLEPNRTGDPDYTPSDVNYIKEQMAAHPECSKVWLVAHHFDPKLETQEFKDLVKNEKRIKGLFSGHTHLCSVVNLGTDFGGKKLAQTGNYSYTWYTAIPDTIDIAAVKDSFWGFRELNITSEAAVSNYIICETKGPVVNGVTIDLKQKKIHSVRFY